MTKFNPFDTVIRTEATDANATAKTITYTYVEDNNAVDPVVVVRGQGVKGRPKTSIEVDHYTLFLTNIHTVFPGAEKAVSKAVTKEKEVKEVKETIIEIDNKEDARTELKYMDTEGNTETVPAKRGIPAPRRGSKILFERVKYVFKKKPVEAGAKKVTNTKVPQIEEFRSVKKAFSIFVYSNGTEIESKGKGAPKRKLDNGETLVHIIKVKPVKKERNAAPKKKTPFVQGENTVQDEVLNGNRITLKDLAVGDKFYRIDTVTGEVMKSQGVMTLTEVGEVVKFDLSIPMKIGNDTLTTNTVRGTALAQNVFKLN